MNGLPFIVCFFCLSLLLSTGCRFGVQEPHPASDDGMDFPTRFKLLPGRDVGNVIDGKTFLANLRGVHPLLGQDVPIRIRGFTALSLPPEKNEDLGAAIAAWTELRRTLENAREIELRLLERGQDGFFIVADVYVEGKLLKPSS